MAKYLFITAFIAAALMSGGVLCIGPYAKLTKYLDDPTCTKEDTLLQVIYFSRDSCLQLSVTPRTTAGGSIQRHCFDDLSGLNATYCPVNPDGPQCATCSGSRPYRACTLENTSDYAPSRMYVKYDCVAEMDPWDRTSIYADLQLFDTNTCNNVVYREIIPLSNKQNLRCVKAPGLTWRYLYVCEGNALSVHNDLTSGNYCPGNVNLGGDYVWTISSQCVPVPDPASAWKGLYARAYCGSTVYDSSTPIVKEDDDCDDTTLAVGLGIGLPLGTAVLILSASLFFVTRTITSSPAKSSANL